ncbi:MAG: hypothetical protein COA84_08980 [Robiginitomaculum sp.]|nr:MAG: hypothetical protein COA84_08980 [Robiginitomaculum sp.]
MKNQRFIPLEGVHNFRDFGGWAAKNGQNVKSGLLYRSGHLSRASETDQATINALGLQTLADLRQPSEREREPNILPDPAPATIFETAHGGYEDAPHLAFLREGNLTVQSVHDYMISAYQRIPDEPHHQRIFADLFKQLRHGEPVLIHCAAGKDRTGILAALILLSVGVDSDQVYEDYMLTNVAVDIDGLLPSIAKRISEQTGQDVEPQALRPMLGVETDFLDATFDAIGPLDAYLENTLGVSDADRQALQDTLLVP